MRSTAIALSIVVMGLTGCSRHDADDPFAGRASSSDDATKGEFKPSPNGSYQFKEPPPAGNAGASADHARDVH